MFCATNPDRTVRTSDIAEYCNSSPNHVAHVVQQLQSKNFIETLRGRSGGLRLARSPKSISIGAVFRLFETGIPFAECFDQTTNTCPLTKSCRLRGFIQRALDAFYHELDMVTLDDLVRGNCGLQELLAMSERLTADCKTGANPDRPLASSA
ncbi:RrF2 family transcriptional regulator [Thalassovita gelatinovora]|nr:Rrf2 family transcriptional regulator [Thalassovita gelatinovora]